MIVTEKVEYRYDQISLKLNMSYLKITEECINLTKIIRFKTAGIDLIKLDNNFFFFFFFLLKLILLPGYCTFEYNFEISKTLLKY